MTKRTTQSRSGPKTSPRNQRIKSRLSPINVILAIALLSMIGFLVASNFSGKDTTKPSYEIVNTFAHDPGAFTQGLAYHDGFLYEGTGEYTKSTIRKTNLETGEVLQIQKLSDFHFGEGIAIHDGKLYQLTWTNEVGLIRDLETFNVIQEFSYDDEGWGLTFDGEHFIMSDGTPTLRFLDPISMEVVRTLRVTHGDSSIPKLNELEMYKGNLLANIWESDRIALISLETGAVLEWFDLSELHRDALSKAGPYQRPDVLNGIAYDAKSDRLFVTGKRWPFLYEIKLNIP